MHFDIYFVVPDTFMFPRSLDFEQINFMRFYQASESPTSYEMFKETRIFIILKLHDITLNEK